MIRPRARGGAMRLTQVWVQMKSTVTAAPRMKRSANQASRFSNRRSSASIAKMIRMQMPAERRMPKRLMKSGAKGEMASTASDCEAAERPIIWPSMPRRSRMSESNGETSPMVVPTTEVQKMAAAKLRRRSGDRMDSAVMDSPAPARAKKSAGAIPGQAASARYAPNVLADGVILERDGIGGGLVLQDLAQDRGQLAHHAG